MKLGQSGMNSKGYRKPCEMHVRYKYQFYVRVSDAGCYIISCKATVKRSLKLNCSKDNL